MTSSPTTTDIGFKSFGKFECRCCLQNVGAIGVLSIYEPWSQPFEGMADTIAEDLIKITHIQITETDEFTKYICNECYEKLKFACTFVACVKENDKFLRLRNSNLDNHCAADKVWPKPIQLEKNFAYDETDNVKVKEEVLSDVECDYDQNGIEQEAVEIKIEPEEFIQQSADCTQLNGIIDHRHQDRENLEDLHLHNGIVNNYESECIDKKVKEEPVSDPEDTDSVPGDLPLQCLLCAKELQSMTGLKAHVIALHSYKTVKRMFCESPQESPKLTYSCATCKRAFSTSTDLMVHETCHEKSVCYACNEKFDSFESLLEHRKSCQTEKSAAIKKHKTLDDVKRKDLSSTTTKVLKCNVCDLTFRDDYYMKIHLKVRHPDCYCSDTNEKEDHTPKRSRRSRRKRSEKT